MAVALIFSVLVTPVMASEDVSKDAGTAQEESDPVLTVGAEEDTENEESSRGILGYIIIFALALGVSLLRPFLMRRSLRNNYYDERVWGLDKHRKF